MELLERVWTPAKVRGREGKREGVWTSLILSLPNSGKNCATSIFNNYIDFFL